MKVMGIVRTILDFVISPFLSAGHTIKRKWLSTLIRISEAYESFIKIIGFSQYHLALKAKFVKHYRTQEVLKAFKEAHAQEILKANAVDLPMIFARQDAEIQQIKAGKLDITDRKSWAWPFLPATVTRLATPILKACVSDDTEFLTKRGWVRADQINIQDQFASMTGEGEFIWAAPKKIMKYRYKGLMVHYVSDMVDQLLTPDHRMLGRLGTYELGVTTERGFVYAKDVASIDFIKQFFELPLGPTEENLHDGLSLNLVWQKVEHPTYVEYDGYVYCPALPPTETILIRRNGKAAWSGNTPYNLRRMSRTPVPRRAINLIKGSVISQPWEIRAIEGKDPIDDEVAQKERIQIATNVFNHPNNDDSFQQWIEMGLEDQCCFGAFPAELRFTPDPDRPLKSWIVNVESLRLFPSWTESTPDMPRYAQMTGLKGERGAQLFYDDEIMYLKDNPSTDNPFGLGCMEVAFSSLNDFLGVQKMSGLAGSDQIHKTFLWWEQPQPDSSFQIVRRYIQNELEGQAKLSIIGGMKKPEVVEVQPVTEDDLLLNWQEMLIRMIANAFDLSAMALNITNDVNKAVGNVLDDRDFRSCIVPRAKRLQEGFTRRILHDKLKWFDLEFVFLNLDDPDAATKMQLLSQMYSTNSVTPNQIRTKMGYQPMDNPMYDLNQFEAMMLMAEAQTNLQNKLADQGMQRQMSQMQQMQQLQQPQGEGDNPQPAVQPSPQRAQLPPSGTLQGQGGGGVGPKIQPLKLKQFPIAGSRYNARQVAHMPINQLTDAINNGVLPKPPQLLKQMQNQDPGILEQMTDEVRQFFEDQLKIEQQNNKLKPVSPKIKKQWIKDQRKRVADQNKRVDEFGEYLQKHGSVAGRPGGKNVNKQPLRGKPGNVNPIQRW
jgi:hypothetical protein